MVTSLGLQTAFFFIVVGFGNRTNYTASHPMAPTRRMSRVGVFDPRPASDRSQFMPLADVSVIVGTLWEDLPEEKKEIFRAEARRLKEEHMVSR